MNLNHGPPTEDGGRDLDPGSPRMSKTACVVPWSTLVVGPDGRASFCCDAPVTLTVDGRPGSMHRDSVDDLWNADEIVQVRAAMARGEKPLSCGVCWKREAEGGVSRRLLMNSAYRQIGGTLAVEALSDEGAGSGFRLERRPDWFILELGNVCNLKCRSCNPISSSRIAADPIHQAWTGTEPAPAAETTVRGRAWFKDIDGVAEMIAAGAGANAMLSLIGGEPFLIDSTWKLLSALVKRGVASRLYVGVLTNGQQRNAKLAELSPHFRGFNVSLSIDGHGKLYEYLRHGGSWSKLIETLDWLRRMPNVDLAVVPTLQNCNALDMVTLLRFFDEHGLQLAYNVLNWPNRLRPATLPPSVRRIAAQRLRRYLDDECKPTNLAVVRGYVEVLEEAGEAFDADAFAEFMTFTNDLDASRGESLSEAAPELVALIRGAGIEWSFVRRHVPAGGGEPALAVAAVLQRVNRTLSSSDAIYDLIPADQPEAYFYSAASQLAEIDARLREHDHPGLADSRAVADFACHYGRMTRVLRAALPHAAVYACDIDAAAVTFCADELGALPVVTGWRPDEDSLPVDLDAVVCVSLLTHTPLEHWRRVLRAWAHMLRPGGVAAFTYLSDHDAGAWLAGEMEAYGSYSSELRADAARSLRAEGFGFAAMTSGYGGEPSYGVAFATAAVVRREIAAAGLELLTQPPGARRLFTQELVIVRKPSEPAAPRAVAAVRRDVSLVAQYDPRCYSPPEAREGSSAESSWARLVAADPPRPLPTELGYADPRVPEVREAQAALAREHGVDAFCYRYSWGADGPLWDAPLRDLVATGRPDFPFCLMVAVEDDEPVAPASAARLFDEIAPALADRRYLRVENRRLVVVRDLERFVQPRAIAAAWRAAAANRGLGELHLCAVQPVSADRPEELGFDSFLEASSSRGDGARMTAAAALPRPSTAVRVFRTVECRRDAADPHAAEVYEQWLYSAVDAARRHGEKLVFLDAWNDWPGGAYLEPDDRDGRTDLLATRRAVRGPASGLVLLRRLRDALGEVGSPVAAALCDLEGVLALHEHTRDRLLATVESALGRNHPVSPERLRRVPVPSRQLPPSGDRVFIDLVGESDHASRNAFHEPIPLRGERVHVVGWAHVGDWDPLAVDLFLVFESPTGANDRVFRVGARVERPDVAAAFPGYPATCGFDTTVELDGLAPGPYRIAIAQCTPDAAYRDATLVTVEREAAACSND